MDYSPPGSCVHGDSPGKSSRVGCVARLQGIFPTQAGLEPGSAVLAGDSLPLVPPGKPKHSIHVSYSNVSKAASFLANVATAGRDLFTCY